MNVETMFDTYKHFTRSVQYTQLRADLAKDVCLMLDLEEHVKHITAPQISYSTYFQIVLKSGDDCSPDEATTKTKEINYAAS